ncbi:Predicted transcriptional regulator [Slackia heliotrinireducens]|uniref:Predicted transcriptional regulator n=1 Tax=Slackia heliotrinireducens (strain ATCC 29202 / DSM 20476 / NCTC 11029 / RHS 1) TaxID=471855 RepID=C7N0T6_SLAHD|nr:helix-turn-helix transcriptional regulator [Slackia heliotrinireducens]ACV21164.1 predicted transcriptional regulator [Slackia heliotrinireducens DSM 20476]VEG98599.1 Predicted transcriptional regulator [Slackia heliotrinireducens]
MTPAISIGTTIYRLRKEARLTQDGLAMHLGVTKASVSKWENGQSYPDIELLPKIAAYFDITIDQLIGYEPQMSRVGIARECARLRAAFANEPFDQAHRQCQQLVGDYYSCYPLLAQIAALYLNHINLVEGNARAAFADEIVELCHRVKRNSESSADIKLAEAIDASVLLVTGNPQAASEALEKSTDIDLGTDLLLASAYQALGRADEADETLQGTLFQSLVLALNRLAQLATLYADRPQKLDVAHARALALIDAFDLENVYVNTAAIHLSFATAHLMGGNVNRALDCLEDYERACRKLEFPIELHGDAFFDRTEAWVERVNIIGTSAPRDEVIIKKSLVESVSANPAFASLAQMPRFQRIVTNLKEIAR